MAKPAIRDRILGIQRVKASELLPHPMNPRRHPTAQMSALQASLDAVGYADCLLAYQHEGKLRLFDGHARRDLTPDAEVPVLVTDLTEAEARMMMQLVDPLAAMAETDSEMLASLRALTEGDRLEGLIAPGPGLDALLGRNGGQQGGLLEGTDPDAIPEEVETRCKSGDLWALGEHRLLCGDSTKAEDVKRLLDGEVPLLMITDPPYGVDYAPEWRNERLGEATRAIGHVRNDSLADWTKAYALFPGEVVYCWTSDRFAVETAAGIKSSGFEIRNQLVWAKQAFVISRGAYHSQHECCWYAVRTGGKAHWIGDRSQSTLWQINNGLSQQGGRGTDPEEQMTGHGTQKPIECMERPMRNHTGDVYDPFVGSGSTLIAAQRQQRRCFAMEIDPHYCDVVLSRFEHLTGRTAELLEPGSSSNRAA